MSWLWSRDVSAAPLLEGAGGRGKLWPSSRDWSILCVTWLNSVKLVMEEKKNQLGMEFSCQKLLFGD